MSKIISISLSEKELDALNELQTEGDFLGRSETIRTALELLKLEEKTLSKNKGISDALLILIHKHSKYISKIIHKNENLIKTHLHNHLKDHRCIEIFIMQGDANKIRELSKEIQNKKDIFLSKLIFL